MKQFKSDVDQVLTVKNFPSKLNDAHEIYIH